MASPTSMDYTIGWIAPIALELTAATAVLDTSMLEEKDRTYYAQDDDTIYTLGKIGNHFVVMVVCPKMGTSDATAVVTNMCRSFPGIKHILVVGIAGGVPSYGKDASEQIVLGDVVVGFPQMGEGGVVQFGHGAWAANSHEVRGHTLHPSSALLGAVNNLRTRHSTKPGTQIPSFLDQLRGKIMGREQQEFQDPGPEQDRLFNKEYVHPDRDRFCEGLCAFETSILRKNRGERAARLKDTPVVHYGTIGSSDSFMASSSKRDEMHREHGIICFEMEASGIVDKFQALVIRGICDYSDSHTNKKWQKYAAATAAAYAKELICCLPGGHTVPSYGTEAKTTMAKDETLRKLQREKCHQMLRTSDYERHKDRNPDPVEGTCVWFFMHPNYLEWRDSATSTILWVTANPGCGKSVLSKLLTTRELGPTTDRATCYFFFKDDAVDQKSAKNALCAILHQLFVQRPVLLRHVEEPFNQNGEHLKENIDLLWKILVAASADPQAGDIICIIDALDECLQSDLHTLLRKICAFYDRHQGTTALKFIVTSRPLQRIENQLSDLSQSIPNIRLAGEDDTEQIRWEIDLVIKYEIAKIHQKWPDDRKAIDMLQKEIEKVENSTYLWLKLIFDLIRENMLQSFTKSGRRRLFDTLPSSVDDAYTTILNKSTSKEEARKLLQIVCVATRPLSPKELFVALKVEEKHTSVEDIDDLSENALKRWIRDLCGLFVSVIDGRVYLLHQTAKEFLMTQDDLKETSTSGSEFAWKHSFSTSSSNFVLAQSCMWYLLLKELLRGYTLTEMDFPIKLSRSAELCFLDYSANNWTVHFRAASVANRRHLTALGVQLCNIQARDQRKIWQTIHFDRWVLLSLTSGLSVTSYLGLSEVVCQLLMAPNLEINETFTEAGWTPLYAAASKGREIVVQQLLEVMGIDVNKADENGETPLSVAAFYGYENIVQQLLAVTDIDVNKANKDGQTPLYIAVFNGHEIVVQQLLEVTGIEANKVGEDGETPLCVAASIGSKTIVQQLLEVTGIDVNRANDNGKTPLYMAAFRGHENIVQQLLTAPSIRLPPTESIKDLLSNAHHHLFVEKTESCCKIIEDFRNKEADSHELVVPRRSKRLRTS